MNDTSLWTLTKNGHVARAVVRDVPGVGSELRYLWDGDLRASTVYRDGSELAAAAIAKRAELEANGWLEQLPPVGNW